MHHLGDPVGRAVASEAIRSVGQAVEMHAPCPDTEDDDEQNADQGGGEVGQAQCPRHDSDKSAEGEADNRDRGDRGATESSIKSVVAQWDRHDGQP